MHLSILHIGFYSSHVEQEQKVKWGQGHFFFSQSGVWFLESTVGNFFAEDDLFGTIPATLEMPL